MDRSLKEDFGTQATMHKSAFTLMRFLSGLLLLVATQLLAAANEKQPERAPGNYVIWASNNESLCTETARIINSLPGKTSLGTVDRGNPGFVKWTTGPRILEDSLPGLQPQPFPIKHFRADLDGSGQEVYVISFAWSVSNGLSDYLYIADRLPSTPADVHALVKSKEADYSSLNYIAYSERAKALSERDRKAWFFWEHASVVVLIGLKSETRPVFLAESAYQPHGRPSSIYTFMLDRSGTRTDLCMLKRACPCGDLACVKSLEKKDQQKLMPPKNLCKK